MPTIPVVVESDDIRPPSPNRDGTLSVLTPESSGSRIREMDVDKLRESLSQLSENAAMIFQNMKQVGDFRLKEVQLQVEVTAEGGFALIGTAKAGVKGAITLTFKE